MKHHRIKIKQIYFWRITEGQKTFEVRINDRDYQVGDIINFIVLRDGEPAEYTVIEYQITYVHSGLGMADNYVVLGIEEINKVKAY